MVRVPGRRDLLRAARAVIGVVRGAMQDNITGEAAKVAYYAVLSLFPSVLVIFALTGIFGGDAAFHEIMERLQHVAPGEASELLARSVREITATPPPGLLSVGLVLTLWSASNVFAALADGLNAMYGIAESRPWWRKRLTALALLLAAAVLLVAGTAMLLLGRTIGAALGLGAAWEAIRRPLAFALVTGLFWLIYYVLPNRDQRGVRGQTLAGALVGTSAWFGATLLFRFYVARFASYGETYGFVGAIIVLMLWLYLTAMAILLGGEVAAELEGRRRVRREARRQIARRKAAERARAARAAPPARERRTGERRQGERRDGRDRRRPATPPVLRTSA